MALAAGQFLVEPFEHVPLRVPLVVADRRRPPDQLCESIHLPAHFRDLILGALILLFGFPRLDGMMHRHMEERRSRACQGAWQTSADAEVENPRVQLGPLVA